MFLRIPGTTNLGQTKTQAGSVNDEQFCAAENILEECSQTQTWYLLQLFNQKTYLVGSVVLDVREPDKRETEFMFYSWV